MWISEWRAISARIQALLDAGAFFLRSVDQELHQASTHIIRNSRETVEIIRTFFNRHRAEFSPEQTQCLFLFIKSYTDDLLQPHSNVTGFSGVTSVVTYLASFRAEFEYLMADATEVTRSMVARAFTHLQRMIVADANARSLWKNAFDEGETRCEALGACHLLLHGVWAFKTSATGERTDLVMNEPLPWTPHEMHRASTGLVLTEWKLVREARELNAEANAAHHQAKRYREGILAGFEVASPRYLVLISEDFVVLPEPRIEGDVVYEFRNIAVNPRSPSQAARTAPPASQMAASPKS
jgi:hypothetical protein